MGVDRPTQDSQHPKPLKISIFGCKIGGVVAGKSDRNTVLHSDRSEFSPSRQQSTDDLHRPDSVARF